IVAAIRRRSEAGGGDAAQLPRALLRQRHAVLHRAFPLAVFGQDQAQGEGIYLRDDLKSPRPALVRRIRLLAKADAGRGRIAKQSGGGGLSTSPSLTIFADRGPLTPTLSQ